VATTADSVKMNRQHEENIARLASLETDVRNLSQDVRLLAASLQTVTDTAGWRAAQAAHAAASRARQGTTHPV